MKKSIIFIIKKNNATKKGFSRMRNNSLSKKCFYTAFVQLMKKYSFEEIQISEICALAGYNRSTFYRNYSSKYDIIMDKFNLEANKYLNLVKESQDYTFVNKVKLLFDLLRESSEIILLMHNSNLDNVMYKMFYEIYPTNNVKNYEQYFKIFRTSGIFHIIIAWVTSGMKESSIEMAHKLQNIMNTCNADY